MFTCKATGHPKMVKLTPYALMLFIIVFTPFTLWAEVLSLDKILAAPVVPSAAKKHPAVQSANELIGIFSDCNSYHQAMGAIGCFDQGYQFGLELIAALVVEGANNPILRAPEWENFKRVIDCRNKTYFDLKNYRNALDKFGYLNGVAIVNQDGSLRLVSGKVDHSNITYPEGAKVVMQEEGEVGHVTIRHLRMDYRLLVSPAALPPVVP